MKLRIFGKDNKERGWNPEDYARRRVDLQVGEYWEIEPGTFYPLMIAYIRQAIQSEDLPAELIDRQVKAQIDPLLAARRYYNNARRIQEVAWGDALVPLQVFLEKGPDAHWLTRMEQRAEALELARLWFTRAVKNLSDRPVAIHILCDPDYRLGVKDFSMTALL